MRSRRSNNEQDKQVGPQWKPGDLILEYAKRMGWTLTLANVFVEGTTDVEYYEIANDIYRRESGLTLLGDDFEVHSIGTRDDGGCDNLDERFRSLRDILRADPVEEHGGKLSIICELDNDYRGRGVVTRLTSARLGFVLYKDVFLLQRKLPRSTRAPHEFSNLVKELNAPWQHLDCEIEDLISRDFLEAFCDETNDALEKAPTFCGPAHHFSIRGHRKPSLVRFMRDYAERNDIEGLIEHLKCLRYSMGCLPDGTPGK